MLQHEEQSEPQPITITPEWERKLNSQKDAEIYEVVEEIGATGQNAVEPLLALLQIEAKKAKRQRTLVNWIFGGAGLFLLSMFLLKGLKGGDWDFPNLWFLFYFGGSGAAYAYTNKHKNVTRALARFDDVRTVGAFVEALEFPDKDIVAMAEQKLTELLPRLQASDAYLLNKEQREILNRQLVKSDGLIVKAILSAYEQVGDSAAIPAVSKLARGEGKGGKMPLNVSAAIACLQFLEIRAKQQEQAQTLLRASESTATAPEMLLRPAHATTETQPETLLRPSQS